MIFADRVKDTTVSVGTGAITLGNSAPTGYQTFATAFGVSPVTVAYCIADQSGPNWEVGSGTFDGATGLTRTTVLASSNAGALVSFTAGTKDVFCTAPAAYLAPSGATTQIPYSNGNTYAAASTFTYNSVTNTLSVGNITGTNAGTGAASLDMTIQAKAPLVTEIAGTINFIGRPSAKANTDGGGFLFSAGLGNGTGKRGSLSFVGGVTSIQASETFSLNGGKTLNAFFNGSQAWSAGDTGYVFDTAPSATVTPEILFNVQGGAVTGGSFKIFQAGVGANVFQTTDDYTNAQIGFFAHAPAPQQTTAIATIARTAVAGGNSVDDNDTFGGYTIGQIVTALKAYGLLA